MYCVDLNPTPFGPPAGLPTVDTERAMAVAKRVLVDLLG